MNKVLHKLVGLLVMAVTLGVVTLPGGAPAGAWRGTCPICGGRPVATAVVGSISIRA